MNIINSAILDMKHEIKNSILRLCLNFKALGLPFLTPLFLKLLKIEFETVNEAQTISTSLYKYGFPAASIISIDFEHLHDKSGSNSLNSLGTLATLKLSEEYKVPLTWAICGKTVKTNKKAYLKILSSKINHDIGIHTFDHIDFSDSQIKKSDIITDLSKCIDLPKLETKPASFIFPYNREGYYEELEKFGFITYRCKKRILGYPKKIKELWRIPPLYYLDESSGNFETAKNLIDLSIAYGGIFHLWFHPRSLAKNGNVDKYIESVLRPIFKYLYQKNLEGKLWMCTMRDLANYCEARLNTMIDETSYNNQKSIKVKCETKDTRFESPPNITLRIPHQEGSYVNISDEKQLYSRIRSSKSGSDLFIDLIFNKPEKIIQISSTPISLVAA